LPTKRSLIERQPGKDRLRFRRRERLKKRAEITRVFKKGKIVTCPGARLFFLKNGLPHNRIVFTFAKKYGNAVERNRAKRFGREAYRHLSPCLLQGFDLVLLAYRSESPGSADCAGGAESRLKILVSRAGLL
jgi:ribonuclease P protein component